MLYSQDRSVRGARLGQTNNARWETRVFTTVEQAAQQQYRGSPATVSAGLILRLLRTPEAGGFDIVTLRQSEELPSDGRLGSNFSA
jgi:hypothetical protein